MRFGIVLMNSDATLNSFRKKDFVEISQGETFDLVFQLVDREQNIRYVPASGCTVLVELARFPEAFPTISNVRVTSDFSVRRNASQAFSDDRSLWKLSLTTTETSNLMSTNMRVTVTEGSKISIALLQQAIKVIPKEG